MSETNYRNHIMSLDLLRIVAAFSIIAFHIIPWRSPLNDVLLTWGVPFFFIISGFFDSRHLVSKQLDKGWLINRLKRLGLPYVFWTALRLVDLSPITPSSLINQFLFCVPTSTLWFLWTLMLVTILISLIVRFFSIKSAVTTSILLGITYSALGQWWESFGALGSWLHQFPQYALQMPFLWMAAYAMGIVLQKYKTSLTLPKGTVVVGIGVLTASLVNPGGLSYNFAWGIGGLTHIIIATGLFIAVVNIVIKPSRIIPSIASYSMGIYLVHPLLIRLMKIASPQYPIAAYVNSRYILMWIAISVSSLTVVYVLKKIPVARKIVA